jgi:hypothetical protein
MKTEAAAKVRRARAIARPRLADAVNTACPWSGDPVRADSLTQYRGEIVGFCNPGCRDKFEAAVHLFDTAIASRPAKGARRR